MSYRCDICGIKVPPKQPRLVHRMFKRNSPDVARELGVCEGCHLMLDQVPLKSIKDPYYLRPRRGASTTVEVLVDIPDREPLRADEVGRVARTVTF